MEYIIGQIRRNKGKTPLEVKAIYDQKEEKVLFVFVESAESYGIETTAFYPKVNVNT